MAAVKISEEDERKSALFCSWRLGLALLAFVGFTNSYCQRVGMSVAIVCMTNQTALQLMRENEMNGSSLYTNDTSAVTEEQCRINGTKKENFDGPFVYTKNIQGQILGSFFYGYLVSQIPGGMLAERFGGKNVYAIFFALSTIATILTPIGARVHVGFLIVLRILAGIGSGALFPCMHAVWGHWAPPMERSMLVSIACAGAFFGNVVALPLSGVLCEKGFDGGYASIFYIFGISSLLWLVFWMIFAADTPAKHRFISDNESNFINSTLKGQICTDNTKLEDASPQVSEASSMVILPYKTYSYKSSLSTMDLHSTNLSTLSQQEATERHANLQQDMVPWLKVLTSMPVWAIVVGNFCTDWGLYTMLTNIPTYMSEVLKFDITSNGLYSALPFIGLYLCMNFASFLADYLRSRKYLTTTMTRKLFQCGGCVLAGVFVILLGFMTCDQTKSAVALLTLGVTITGFTYSGWLPNHMDIAPKFAGTLYGLSNGIGAMSGFIAPAVAAALTVEQDRASWQKVFYICAAVYVAGAVFYGIFASGEIQPWAEEKIVAEEEFLRDGEGKEMVTFDKNDRKPEKV